MEAALTKPFTVSPLSPLECTWVVGRFQWSDYQLEATAGVNLYPVPLEDLLYSNGVAESSRNLNTTSCVCVTGKRKQLGRPSVLINIGSVNKRHPFLG